MVMYSAMPLFNLLITVCLFVVVSADIGNIRNVERINDHKSFKKLLRVRTNVLVLLLDGAHEQDASVRKVLNAVSESASEITGIGTMALIDCNASDGKKLCKKLKAQPKPYILQHYSDGVFHIEYDRQMTAKSMSRFMRNPTADVPWDEEPSSGHVHHIENKSAFAKLMGLNKPTLVMFYAPWCGHCKTLKPQYSAAAEELGDSSILAAVDATLESNERLVQTFKVQAYPTLHYFEKGEYRMKYTGGYSKDGILAWLKAPTEKEADEPEETEEEPWSETPSEVVHLGDDDFDTVIADNPSVLVMFYAPWCGHCKKAKPEYTSAAEQLKEDGVQAVLAAVDATQHKKAAEKLGVDGFPTFAYYKDGKFAWKVNERTKDGFYKFMKNPVEPPPPELPWSEQQGDVLHLKMDNFKAELKKKRDALVMFYTPWCGYCKRAKPFYSEAAQKLSSESRIVLAAVDCTTESSLCQDFDVKGYPTIIYLSYGKNRVDYNGKHDTESFIEFVGNAGHKKTEL